MPRLLRLLVGLLTMIVGAIGLVIVILVAPLPQVKPPVYGVSFAPSQAVSLGLDWREAYRAILDDLGVRRFRLNAPWNQLEPAPGQFYFDDLDYQINEASARGARVVVAIGRKVPRWPECHIPAWASSLSETEQQQRILELISQTVTRYRDNAAITMWQLENEPLLDYGNCPPYDQSFFEQEHLLLRALDPGRPILVTDSGELNWWLEAARYGDTLGTTMYRTVHSSRLDRPFHYDYIFPAALYRGKARLVRWLRDKTVLIAELQGEPWGKAPIPELPAAERRALLSVDRLRAIERFAARTQLPEAYWWGVEFWYWEKVKNNNAAYWNIARAFFK